MKDVNNFITVVGNVGTDPVVRTHANDFKVTQFRLGADIRGRNQQSGEWETKSTNWYTIKVFHQLGLNAHASLRKGQRVFVAGYAKVDQYTREDGSTGTGIDVEAEAIGHDLKFGTTEFARLPQLFAPRGDGHRTEPGPPAVQGDEAEAPSGPGTAHAGPSAAGSGDAWQDQEEPEADPLAG
ncbi:single-stranded DNA-binding protein [Arthrobacter sp. AOP36-A1-22]|uniref:single-stranded DNA-binding protein n=1 Tax=unclassified Arthrobacter TaxID=235627 RepID=UPI0026535383|nr:single-stranded DNA-binding protein [Micrococcaceae bacterium]